MAIITNHPGEQVTIDSGYASDRNLHFVNDDGTLELRFGFEVFATLDEQDLDDLIEGLQSLKAVMP